MHRETIKKLADEQIRRLCKILASTSFTESTDVREIESLLKELADASKILGVYEFHLTQQEVSPEINPSLKLTPENEPASEDTVLINSEQKTVVENEKDERHLKSEESIHELSKETSPDTKSPAISDKADVGDRAIQQDKKTNKKLEISINDKFRIINELFLQNQQEYTDAIEQLNNVNSLQEAELCLSSLTGHYNWDQEKPVFKILSRIVSKRFL